MNRREALKMGAGLGAATSGSAFAAKPRQPGFLYCLNTATLRGRNLTIVEEIEIASKAGYDAVEPWMDELDRYAASGGSLPELGRRFRDAGLTVESAIGFPEWLVDDDARRARGLAEAKRSMELLREIGGKRLAAPPAGATDRAGLPLERIAERYLALLEIGDQAGITPELEIWGFSKSVSRLGEAVGAALETGHSKACVLPDVFHLYKGGSDFGGFRLLNREAFRVLHMNDYPASPPRAEITDAQRVYPGDGVAPLTQLLALLREIGFDGALSLELFNPLYGKQDALAVAKTGLRKLREAVAKATEEKAVKKTS
jgi:sugar phosphate isomerase/epimerase